MSSVGSSESSREPERCSLPAAGSAARKSAGAAAISSTCVAGNSSPAAAASWAAVSTSMRRTPAGAGSATLAAISVTSAPRLAAAAARAIPIRPLERLPMKRTGSIGSRVPPAVTRTRSPSQGRLPAGSAASTRASSCSGSGRRPRPYSPREASLPSSGSITSTPRSRSVARFAWVAASAYMRSFIAGARSRGAVQARKEVVSIESAAPAASLEIVLAEAGATRKASQRPASSRWPIGSWETWPLRRGRRPAAGRARTRR